MGKTFLSSWECTARFYPGLVGLLIELVRWVAMMVDVMSASVGPSVGVMGLIDLDSRQRIMGKYGC